MKTHKALFLALSIAISTQFAAVEVVQSSLFSNVLHTKETKFFTNKKKCVLFWDLNSVVFTKDTSPKNIYRMTRSLIRKKGIKHTVKGMFKFGKLWRKKKKLKKAGDNRGFVWDAMFNDLAKKDPQLAEQLRSFSQHANNLEDFMSQLLFDLHKAGHHNAVLSNMGQGLLDIQIEQIKATKKPYTQATNYTLEFLQDHAYKTIASAENNWMHKPNAKIYHVALEKNKPFITSTTCKIFIDDKECNCRAAVENGFDVAIICNKQHDIRPILRMLGVEGI